MKISEIAATLTGEGMMSKNTSGGQDAPSDEIARLAYCLYEARGRRDGHDVDDWLEAERELADSFRGPQRSTALTGVQV
jgi:Protein of unknown function (DUF2934)